MEKKKAEAAARKELAQKAAKGGPLVTGGIKKSVPSVFSNGDVKKD